MTPWTEQYVETLKRCRADGMSATQIATELYMVHRFPASRSAVLGKILRLKLPNINPSPVRADGRRPPPKPRPAPRKQRRYSPPSCELAAEIICDIPADESPAACTLGDLTGTRCRWPLGEPGTEAFRYCGVDKPDGCPYCARHARLAYQRRAA